jgi:short-chain fatty acids transporter
VNIVQAIERAFRTLLPTPFTIAVLLTLLTMLLAFMFTRGDGTAAEHAANVVRLWENGLWNQPMLVFATQMMLMLVLGHILALSGPAERIIGVVVRFCNSTAQAAFWVTLLTVAVSLFNWGLGLVFGAIFARKVGERAAREGIRLNYPLIGAAGYSGMMTWHSGISGSAPIKAAEEGHLSQLLSASIAEGDLTMLPSAVPLSDTVFGAMNLFTVALLLTLLPLFMFLLGKRFDHGAELPSAQKSSEAMHAAAEGRGAERLDRSRVFTSIIGLSVVAWCGYIALGSFAAKGLGFITPNFINLLLLGLGLSLHSHVNGFLVALDNAIGGASGILIQFPLYFGIMGIMAGSGLAAQLSDFFVSISSTYSFPVLTLLSASILNVFIPSGGGQWGVQGPIVLQAAMEIGASIPKSIMALAYGDQLTNMLQPFWALPLLGVTGLKAKEILPYSLLVMCLGAVIFTVVLLIF